MKRKSTSQAEHRVWHRTECTFNDNNKHMDYYLEKKSKCNLHFWPLNVRTGKALHKSLEGKALYEK